MPIKEYVQGERADIFVITDEHGNSEMADFIENLGNSDQRKLVHLFKMFCEQGTIRNREKFNYEGDHIYAFKSSQVRILCTYLPGKAKRTLLLLNHFVKKTQRLPKTEKQKAQLLYNSIITSI